MLKSFVVLCLFGIFEGYCQSNFANYFKDCKKDDPDFDDCIMNALNDLRPLFKTGVPEYGIQPFDPFFASEVPQRVGGKSLNYKLVLRNVRESGWTSSQVTRFGSDFNKYQIQYTQFFPDKYLKGDYDFVGTVLGNKIANRGTWNLSLYDLIQTTTVSRKPPVMDASGHLNFSTPLSVHVDVQKIGNMDLHISNLLGGRKLFERGLDSIINAAWQPGFVVMRPLINDLVSTAFTGIFNKNFQNFPFDEIIK